MILRNTLLVALAALALIFIIKWRRAAEGRHQPSLMQIAIGFVTDFFDTLGIGSFATTTTAYKVLKVVPDEKIVGTMLIGHSLPVVAQAFIFIVAVQVEPAWRPGFRGGRFRSSSASACLLPRSSCC